MTDNKSLAFRLVKYLLIIMYFSDCLIFSLIILLGFIKLITTGEAVREFREDVKDFGQSYNQDAHIYYAIFIIFGGSILILVTIYFIYAAYIESLKQNLVIACLMIIATMVQLKYGPGKIEAVLYGLWSDLILVIYVYLIYRNKKALKRFQTNVQVVDEESMVELDMI